MTDSQETPPRLSPPPKVGRVAPDSLASAATSRRVRADRGLLYWLTGLLFLALGATAFAVFVFLPDWIPESSSAATAAQPTEEAAGETAPDVVVATPAVVDPTAPAAEAPANVAPTSTPAPPPRREEPSPPPQPARTPTPAPVDTAEIAFGQAMTAGLARLAEGELGTAEQAFRQALTLRPGSPQASDGLARVESERQLLAIGAHRERAASHEEQERWSEAAAEYAAVLTLDPTIRFAQQGQASATARHDLSVRLEAYIAHPDRLSSDEVLADGRFALSEGRQIASPGPLLSRQIERLAAQIEIAATPIRVSLVSDDETDILVFRVGRLGTFERRTLDLRPGSYTVVGSRAGYRDVRRTLVVTPGKADISLTIRCEEKI